MKKLRFHQATSRIMCLLMLLSFLVKAQETVELNDDFQRKGEVIFTKKTLFFIDSTGKRTLPDIQKETFFNLSQSPFTLPIRADNAHTYWLKFKLKNTSNSDTIKALFSCEYHYSITLYVFDNQHLISKINTNQALTEDERLYRYDERYIPIIIAPNRAYSYYAEIKILTLKPTMISPKIISYERENQQKVKSLYDDRFAIAINYSIAAVLLFLGIFTLLQFALNNQKYFLYYSYYLFSIFAFVIWGFIHSPYNVHFMSFLPFLKFSLRQNFYILLSHFFYFLFIKEFLELNKTQPIIDRYIRFLLKTIIGMLIIEVLLGTVFTRLIWEARFTLFSQIYLSIFGIIIILYIYQIKTKIAIFIKIGSTILLISAIFGFLAATSHWYPEKSELFEYYPANFFNYCIMLEILCFSMGLGYKTSQYLKEKNRLEQAVALSELRTLRLQINPHFLFNSLNSIKSYMIKHKTKEAAEYLTDFSTLVRSILHQSKEQVVSLKDELETLKLYIKLEQLRYHQKFEVIYDIDSNIKTEAITVPALLLQPYVENAIKHGLGNKDDNGVLKLIIKCLDDKVEIIIEDDGVGRKCANELNQNQEKHQSMGMKINEDRIKLLNEVNGWHITIRIIDKFKGVDEPDGTKVIVEIPVI